ncbi:hypothetical protein RB195_015801 [Necator americanus]|uniref:TIL domain-containing protein n=1 Tax=Necator americanus TaxID=51031 RepID=A0ABR1E8X5_NECAM
MIVNLKSEEEAWWCKPKSLHGAITDCRCREFDIGSLKTTLFNLPGLQQELDVNCLSKTQVLLSCKCFSAQRGKTGFLLLPAVNTRFRRCFANEQFNVCASHCEATCRDPSPEICLEECIPRCECKPGFLRNEYGACVDDCDSLQTLRPTCNANEEFRECGTACEPTCWNPAPKNCSKKCVLGCQCKEGYFRNGDECAAECEDDDNVAPGDVLCPENEELVECGGSCEPTCESRDSVNPDCIYDCIGVICRCREGFVRNSEDKCILPKECLYSEKEFPFDSLDAGIAPADSCDDLKCPEGTACSIEDRCSEPPCPPPVAVCSPSSQSSSETCAPNELLKECFGCEPTCDHMNPNCEVTCGRPRCVCEEGFARTSFGECVEKENCFYPAIEDRPSVPVESNPFYQGSSVMCGRNEVSESCFGCEPTCDSMEPMSRDDSVVQGFTTASVSNKSKDFSESTKARQGSRSSSCNKSTRSGPDEVRFLTDLMGFRTLEDRTSGTDDEEDCEVICGSSTCVCEEGLFRSFLGDCVTKDECSFLLDRPDVSDSDLLPQESSWMCGPNELLKKCFGCEPSCLHMDPMNEVTPFPLLPDILDFS